MKLQDLYINDIDRKVNPAVSATDLDAETVKVEIEEYVFTKEILKNLYKVLSNIKQNSSSHCGIWISGYYGSGKSHFLKYLDYCMSPEFSEKALFGFETATAQYDALKDDVNWMPSDIRALTDWYTKRANIETIMFNIGSSYNAGSEKSRIFTEVLWSEFNAMRGYNKFNIALAQYLEKFLDKQGKFEEFKQRLSDEHGFDWATDASDLATTELDIPLDLAKEIVPTFSVDAARHAIINRTVDLSVNNFADELAQYIKDKNDPDYRLVFFIDEVSQFINSDGRLLLQLQSIVKEIHDRCNDQVWVACTAQQDLREILDNCQINESRDDFGKILGRFEVQASLSGTSSEYIAQKRILAKKPEAQTELTRFYTRNASAIDTQFQLPAAYQGYRDKDTFIDYYPFVPYQLQLINNVFTQFVELSYVNKEVKGNERSVIRITHNIAKRNKDSEVGTFISFDQFFNDMFRASLQPAGVQALRNAEDQAAKFTRDPDFAMRVVDVLFMICNMSPENKRQFPATVENIVTLLMRDVDTPKTTMKDDVQRVIDHLIENSIIRENKPDKGAVFYEFYTQEEAELSRRIQTTQVDSNSEAEQMAKIFSSYFSPVNKESIGSGSVNVGVSTSGKRMFGASGTTDIEVEFVVASPETDANRYSFNNPANKLVFFLTPLYAEEKRLKSQFYHFCQVDKFAKDQNLTPEQRQMVETFAQREKVIYDKDIVPAFNEMLDSCQVISGNRLLSKADIGDVKGKARYKAAISAHIKSVYNMAHLVDGHHYAQSQQELRTRILRRLDSNEYALKPMTDAEEMVMNHIMRQGHDVTVGDITATFAKAPYGWNEIATIDVINELYRRDIFAYAYNNNPNVKISEVADKIVREKGRFTLEKAQAISPETVKAFNEAWKAVFNRTQSPTNDARELFRLCHDDDESEMKKVLKSYEAIRKEISRYPFVADIDKVLEMFGQWRDIREPSSFFESVIAQRNEAAALLDRCKQVVEFYREQLNKYRDILSFTQSNTSNFELLGEEAKADVEDLKAMADDENVYTHFPDYIRLQKAVRSRIETKKTELVQIVRTAYDKVYQFIRNIAAEKDVEPTFLPDIESRMLIVKNETSLYKLRDMADVSDFKAQMVGSINEIVTKREAKPAPPKPDDKKKPELPKPPKELKMVTLNTAIDQSLKTEQDVDLYLAALKEQLMQHINNNEEILIK